MTRQTTPHTESQQNASPAESDNAEPARAAPQGSLESRTPSGSAPGITSHSASEESERQKKVAPQRPDAQAGVNQFRKKPA